LEQLSLAKAVAVKVLHQHLIQLLLSPRSGPVHQIEPRTIRPEPPGIFVGESVLADRPPG